MSKIPGRMSGVSVCVTIVRRVLMAGKWTGKRDNMPDKRPARRTTGHEVLCGGLLTGLATGLAWSSVVELFSRDQSFSGTEFLMSLVVPGLVAVLVWKLWRTGLVFGVIVAYLTLLIPLIGIGMGGANVLEATFGGTIAGIVYGSPWAIWRAFRPPADHGGSAELVPTFPGSDEVDPTAVGFEIDGGVSPDE